ncbi:low temperature requirement protein A [Solwaraspora sp. WMMB335]|uniref:low temperature requirement protein A n=1 Tax=Solwaraspora sp. WMMB335 TaxID=3404118 RepID=UPI003B95157D
MTSPHPLRRSRWLQPILPGSRVTSLELFYDLIFVFAFLNVAGLLSRDTRAGSLLSGAVVLALLWWCWTGFVALGNTVRVDHGPLPVIGVAIMAATFVMALSIPQAFVNQPGDLPGPVVFGACYLAVRLLTLAAFWSVLTTAGRSRRQLWALVAPAVLASALIAAAVLVPRLTTAHAVAEVRVGLWIAALLVEYSIGLVLPYARWSVVSAGHWSERHALIVLIALGEAVISLGLAPGRFDRLSLTGPVVVASVLGIVLVGMLWWLHFDTLAPSVEQALHGTRDEVRIPLARDVFTYLHLAIVIGVVYTALGLKLIVEVIAEPDVSVATNALVPLYGGVALYLLAEAGIAARTFRRPRYSTVLAGTTVVGLGYPAALLPPPGALFLLVGVCAVLAAFQFVAGTGGRREVQATLHGQEQAAQQAVSRWRAENL